MGSERAQAMSEESRNPYGRPSFLYVEQDELERLGITSFKAAVGDNIVRIIPPKDPRVPWAKKVFIHRNIGANNSTYICPNKMYGKPCPVCEHAKRIKDEDPDNEGLSALWPKLRHLIFLYDVTTQKEEEKGLRWWDAPASKSCAIVENIVALSRDPTTGAPLDVSDPETGMDIGFARKGTDRNTTYMGYRLIANGAIPKEWCENVPEFDSVLEVSTYEEIYTELHGRAPAPADAVGQQPATRTTRQTVTRTTTAAPAVAAPAVAAQTVDEKETPVDTQPETQPALNTVTRTSRSAGGVSPINTTAAGGEQSISQKLEDIKARRAARVAGGSA